MEIKPSLSHLACLLAPALSLALAGCPLDTCVDKVCDSRKWLLTVVSSDDVWPSVPWGTGCLRSYRPAFFEEFSTDFTAIDLRPNDLTLAVAALDGTLLIADFGAKDASAMMELGAVGVAWSNAGDRLAVATRDAGATPAHTLLILRADLSVVDEIPIDIPLPEVDATSTRIILSWSADDSRIAVSTDAQDYDPSPSNEQVAIVCLIVEIEAATFTQFTLANAYYLGNDSVVAVTANSARVARDSTRGRVAIVTLGDGRIGNVTPVSGAVLVFDSHPPTGVFTTQEPEQLLVVGSRPVVLRTATSRSTDLLNTSGPFIDLRPIDEVEAALIAAGFGPNDFVNPGPDFSCPDPDPDTP